MDSSQRHARILVADDDGVFRQVTEMHLTSWGYQVFSARNAAEAWQVMLDQPIDLLLCDIVMPDRDGLALARQVRQQWPDLPVLMCSSLADRQTIAQAAEFRAFDYIRKPLDVEILREKVEPALLLRQALVERSPEAIVSWLCRLLPAALRGAAGQVFEVRPQALERGAGQFGQAHVLLPVSGTWTGCVAVCFPRQMALDITERAMGSAPAGFSPVVRECLTWFVDKAVCAPLHSLEYGSVQVHLAAPEVNVEPFQPTDHAVAAGRGQLITAVGETEELSIIVLLA